MADLLRGVGIVYHLACLGVRHSIHSPVENHEVNADATLQLLLACRGGGRRPIRLRLELRGLRDGAQRAR